MKREERFELVYIGKDGTERRCYPRSVAKKEENLRVCKEQGIKVISCKKLYPFNMMKNQHNFALIANIAYNTMWDMEHEERPWNTDEYNRLAETREKAERFFTMPLPIAWVPWEDYKEMKELAIAAECHRDAACARAHSATENDYSAAAPWKAPGMSARDFVR